MKVVNVVLSGRFSRGLLLNVLQDCVYRPERFSGAVKAHKGSTFLLFGNGNFVCLGSTTIGEGRNISKSLGKSLGLEVVYCVPKNIVMSHNLKFSIDLPKLYEMLRVGKKEVLFEEEIFNGIVWKERGATVRLFHTGKFFVTGLRKLNESSSVCKYVCLVCKQCKK